MGIKGWILPLNKLIFKYQKNLLAFSGGIDSTALFFLLIENDIPFDIAIVDYKIREQSKLEVAYAKELAKKYDKKCFIKEFPISSLKFTEKKARDFRYSFFKQIIKENKYEALITAHQLNDKLEWFLMQFGKGAGLAELVGLQESEQREDYQLIRPILDYSKDDLQNYLVENNIKYFIDETNIDTKYKRNYIRKEFANKFLDEYKEGVKRSFKYLNQDLNTVYGSEFMVYSKNELIVFRYNKDENIAIRIIDKELKKRGILISSLTRTEILKQKEIIIKEKIAISLTHAHIWIAPKSSSVMDKKFKECCRVNKVPKNVRAYIKQIGGNCEDIQNSISSQYSN